MGGGCYRGLLPFAQNEKWTAESNGKICRKSINLPFNAESEVRTIENLLRKYAGLPIFFADACLVRMVELYPRSTLITLDKDFLIYRKHGNQMIPLLMPGD